MFMCMCLDSTTKGPVSKMTEENTAAIEIGNWTRTSMKSHGKHFWPMFDGRHQCPAPKSDCHAKV